MKLKRILSSMLVGTMLCTTLLAPQVSASSVSGALGGYSCRGSNTVTSSGGSATTTFGTTGTVSASLTYKYVDSSTNIIKTITPSNGNYASSVYVSTSKPSGTRYRSYSSQSTHTVSRNSGLWKETTAINSY